MSIDIEVKELTLFGYPVRLEVSKPSGQTIDLTHTLRFDSATHSAAIDLGEVHRTIQRALSQGIELPQVDA